MSSPVLSPEVLSAVAEEGKILPCVRELAKTANQAGYTSVTTWLRRCSPKELSILLSSGPRVNLPNSSDVPGKIENGVLKLTKEEISSITAEAAPLCSFKIAASILSQTAGADEDQVLPAGAAQDFLNTLMFLEMVRRKGKSFTFDLSDLTLDASLYSEMLSKRIRLGGEFDDSPEAKESLRVLRKSLDNLQIMSRCKARREYLSTSLADELGVPIDYFVKHDWSSGPPAGAVLEQFSDMVKSRGPLPEGYKQSVRIACIPRDDPSPEAAEFRKLVEKDPDALLDPRFDRFVKELTDEELPQFLDNPEAFIRKVVDERQEKGEGKEKVEVPPVASDITPMKVGLLSRLKKAWAAFRYKGV